MIIQKIQKGKEKYIDLLLIGDEQKDMIRRYLDRGDLYVLSDEEPICCAVVTDEQDGVCELKNISVYPSFQKKGYGRIMMEFLLGQYCENYDSMIVGTGDGTSTVNFYTSLGFEPYRKIEGFFTDNYDHPMYEDGVQLKDMIYLKKALN